jgi:hypothetical protein
MTGSNQTNDSMEKMSCEANRRSSSEELFLLVLNL